MAESTKCSVCGTAISAADAETAVQRGNDVVCRACEGAGYSAGRATLSADERMRSGLDDWRRKHQG